MMSAWFEDATPAREAALTLSIRFTVQPRLSSSATTSLALVALDLHHLSADGAAGAAALLEVAGEVVQPLAGSGTPLITVTVCRGGLWSPGARDTTPSPAGRVRPDRLRRSLGGVQSGSEDQTRRLSSAFRLRFTGFRPGFRGDDRTGSSGQMMRQSGPPQPPGIDLARLFALRRLYWRPTWWASCSHPNQSNGPRLDRAESATWLNKEPRSIHSDLRHVRTRPTHPQRRAGRRLYPADPYPAASDSRGPYRAGHAGHRPDRHRQDRGLRAAHVAAVARRAPGPPARPGHRAHARTRRADQAAIRHAGSRHRPALRQPSTAASAASSNSRPCGAARRSSWPVRGGSSTT